MRVGEKTRFAVFFGGILLWLCYPFAFWFGISARWLARCEHRPWTGEMDDCHNDYLPLAEMLWCVIVWLLAVLFFRLARAMWAPVRRPGVLGWIRRRDPAYLEPLTFWSATFGAAWAAWNLVSIPFQSRFAALICYWFLFSAWFAGGAITNWRPVKAADE